MRFIFEFILWIIITALGVFLGLLMHDNREGVKKTLSEIKDRLRKAFNKQ